MSRPQQPFNVDNPISILGKIKFGTVSERNANNEPQL